jgi:adenine-specific DNA glycosylase
MNFNELVPLIENESVIVYDGFNFSFIKKMKKGMEVEYLSNESIQSFSKSFVCFHQGELPPVPDKKKEIIFSVSGSDLLITPEKEKEAWLSLQCFPISNKPNIEELGEAIAEVILAASDVAEIQKIASVFSEVAIQLNEAGQIYVRGYEWNKDSLALGLSKILSSKYTGNPAYFWMPKLPELKEDITISLHSNYTVIHEGTKIFRLTTKKDDLPLIEEINHAWPCVKLNDEIIDKFLASTETKILVTIVDGNVTFAYQQIVNGKKQPNKIKAEGSLKKVANKTLAISRDVFEKIMKIAEKGWSTSLYIPNDDDSPFRAVVGTVFAVFPQLRKSSKATPPKSIGGGFTTQEEPVMEEVASSKEAVDVLDAVVKAAQKRQSKKAKKEKEILVEQEIESLVAQASPILQQSSSFKKEDLILLTKAIAKKLSQIEEVKIDLLTWQSTIRFKAK